MANEKVVEKLEEIKESKANENNPLNLYYEAKEILADYEARTKYSEDEVLKAETEQKLIDIINKNEEVLQVRGGDHRPRSFAVEAVARYGMEEVALRVLDNNEASLYQDDYRGLNFGMECIYVGLERATAKAMQNKEALAQKTNFGYDMGHLSAWIGVKSGVEAYFDLNKDSVEKLTQDIESKSQFSCQTNEKDKLSNAINTSIMKNDLTPQDKKLGAMALTMYGTDSFIGRALINTKMTSLALEKIREFNELGILAINEKNYVMKVVENLNADCGINEVVNDNENPKGIAGLANLADMLTIDGAYAKSLGENKQTEDQLDKDLREFFGESYDQSDEGSQSRYYGTGWEDMERAAFIPDDMGI